jgi:hypothetical protein
LWIGSGDLALAEVGVGDFLGGGNGDRVHQTLRVAPAMQAGLADHVWELRN